MSAAHDNIASMADALSASIVADITGHDDPRSTLPQRVAAGRGFLLDAAADFARTWAAGIDRSRLPDRIVAEGIERMASEFAGIATRGSPPSPTRPTRQPDPPTPRAA